MPERAVQKFRRGEKFDLTPETMVDGVRDDEVHALHDLPGGDPPQVIERGSPVGRGEHLAHDAFFAVEHGGAGGVFRPDIPRGVAECRMGEFFRCFSEADFRRKESAVVMRASVEHEQFMVGPRHFRMAQQRERIAFRESRTPEAVRKPERTGVRSMEGIKHVVGNTPSMVVGKPLLIEFAAETPVFFHDVRIAFREKFLQVFRDVESETGLEQFGEFPTPGIVSLPV